MRIFSESGGLVYHLRAIRYRGELWRLHRERLRQELSNVRKNNPAPAAIVWVGMSAAHELDTNFWLSLAPNHIVIEPDPIARLILRIKVGWCRFRRALARNSIRLGRVSLQSRSLRGKERIVDRLGEPASSPIWVVFANLIGQVPEIKWNFSELLADLGAGAVLMSWHEEWSEYVQPDGIRVRVDHRGETPFPGARSGEPWVWELKPGVRHEVVWMSHFPPA